DVMGKLTVQFSDQASEVLSDLSQKDQVSKTEILRRALSVYKYLEQETRGGKRKIAITDEDGTVVKEILITK
ncbi:MAG TPA: hypothetical protein VJ044_12595, partial [Candidatus Hodarchaeales archaeon]|nr:hypothetical protein [Candidatus Hodarchaeales archaeon]